MHSDTQIRLQRAMRPISEAMVHFEDSYVSAFREGVPFLQPVLSYIGEGDGKRLRPILYFLSQGLVSRPDPDSADVAVMLELLHTATLIHDDVVDGSPERRGRKSLNAIWGDRVSVLVGDYLFARVLEMGVDSGRRGVLRMLSRVVADMGRGELRQELRDASHVTTEEEYYQHVREKTAGLFVAACCLGGLVADGSEEELARLERFGEAYGTAFQIRDDILDFTGRAGDLGKPVGQDLSNGTMTLPLILALERADAGERETIVRKLGREDGQAVHNFVEEGGGIGLAGEKACDCLSSAMHILRTFPDSDYRRSLEDLVDFDRQREG